MHKDYDNIIFDLGDVLLDYRWKEMLMDYGFSENEAIRLGRQLFDNELWSKFDEGIYSEEEIVKAYVELYPSIIQSICISQGLRFGESLRS